MLKNKFKLIVAFLTAIIMLFTCSICFAENEEQEPSAANGGAQAAVENQEGAVTEANSQNAKNGDLYLLDQTVTVDYPVDGNAFIIADTVTIKSQIGGDAFILANTLNIEGGYIYSNLFTCASNVTINGIVYDLYSCAGTTTISQNGYVYRDAHIGTDNLNILGAVGRNVVASANNISFTDSQDNSKHGTVYGSLEYFAQNKASFDESFVEGGVKFNQQTEAEEEEVSPLVYVQNFLGAVVLYIILAAISYMIYTKLTTKFHENSNNILKNKLLPVIGYGLLGIVVGAFATIVLMLASLLTGNVGLTFMLLSLFVGAMLVFSLTFVVICAELIINKAKLEGTWKKLGIVALVTTALIVIELIPYIEGLIVLATIVIGLGTIIAHCLPEKAEKAKPESTKN